MMTAARHGARGVARSKAVGARAEAGQRRDIGRLVRTMLTAASTLRRHGGEDYPEAVEGSMSRRCGLVWEAAARAESTSLDIWSWRLWIGIGIGGSREGRGPRSLALGRTKHHSASSPVGYVPLWPCHTAVGRVARCDSHSTAHPVRKKPRRETDKKTWLEFRGAGGDGWVRCVI